MSKRSGRGGWRAIALVVLLASLVVGIGLVLHFNGWRESAVLRPAASTTAHDGAAPGVPSARGAFDAHAAQDERSSVASLAVPTPDSLEQLRILVVDHATGAVVPRARVLVARADVDRVDRDAAEERFGSVEGVLENGWGVEYACDERGVVLAPRPTCRSWVLAGSEPRHGIARVPAGAASVRVEIEDKHCLSVEVVDRAQRPAANVRLVLLERDEMDWSRIWSGQSDERGRATIHALDEDASNADVRLVLGTTLIRSQPAQFEFTLATLPSAPVRLVVDDGGVVELSLIDSAGQPIQVLAEMRLQIDRERRGELPLPMQEGWLQCWPSREGRARYEHVGLGLPLVASASAASLDFADRAFEGPKLAAKVVHATVTLRRAMSILRGRLLDVEGHPLGERSIEASATRVGASRERGYERLFESQTEANGTFLGELSSSWDGFELARVRLLVTMNGRPPAPVELACPPATIDPVPTPHSVIELGDVIVHPPPLAPLVLSGRVVDEHGRPSADAKIQICPVPAADPPHWNDLRVTSAGDGTFEIRATIDAARVRVRAIAYQRSCAPVEVAVGATDVVLTLREPGTIIGSVVLPHGLDVNVLDLTFRAHESATGDAYQPSSYEWNDEGVFRTVVWPGTYGLEVAFGETTLATRDDIVVVAGATVRLEPIDLREKLHAIDVSVVDERGERVSDGSVDVLVGDQRGYRAEITHDGSAVVASLSAQPDVVVLATGFRAQMFRSVASGARLSVSAGIGVELRTAEFEDEVFELTIRLRYAGKDPLGEFVSERPAIVARDGKTRATLPLAGRYAAQVGLRRKTSSAWELCERIGGESEVVVGERGGEFAIAVTKAAIEAALKRARGL